jgi:hypothetical protein
MKLHGNNAYITFNLHVYFINKNFRNYLMTLTIAFTPLQSKSISKYYKILLKFSELKGPLTVNNFLVI